ncbi:MAG: lipid-A-disaccharide synthase [Candidatus Marinimicrobia bacterium]|nr:lipid-A-disaccharide synthase [Candidatus Neomarinimicrobiota bacterium]|tara:strand:- start:52872 stop:53987 length:1116 start_codon:yes stop_codon:yes gene_type:complete
MAKAKNIVIIAGEESGDINASGVIKAMQDKSPEWKFFGIGGRRLSDAGLELIEHIENMSVMGFAEILMHYNFLKKTFNKMLDEVDKRKPARAILVDYPGFNLRFAKEMKKRNIPVTYFISPQVWAWKENRISTIIECVDQMICIFPFEKSWYKERGVDVHFVGHPLMDKRNPTFGKSEFITKHNIPQNSQIIALMPGSRQQEIDRHLPIMISSIIQLNEKFDIIPILGLAPGVKLSSPIPTNIKIECDKPDEVLRHSKIGLVCSGTISLQAAYYTIPSVVIYRMNPMSWVFTKALSKVKYASMTNLIAEREILPELLQKAATPDNISSRLVKWLSFEEEYCRIKDGLKLVRNKLGSPGCSQRAAQLIFETL